jgi:hypothetical protein
MLRKRAFKDREESKHPTVDDDFPHAASEVSRRLRLTEQQPPSSTLVGFAHHLSAQSLKVSSVVDNIVDLVMRLQTVNSQG